MEPNILKVRSPAESCRGREAQWGPCAARVDIIYGSGVCPNASRYGSADNDRCTDLQRPDGRKVWGGN